MRIGRQVVEAVPANVETPWTNGGKCPKPTARNASIRSADLSCGSTDSLPGRVIRRGSDSYEIRGNAHTP